MKQGKLIYVIGPSGCGKDSVMSYAREHCPGSETAFAHRYITRDASAGGENHVTLQPDEFQVRLERGVFALHWDSHGFRYAVGCEINDWMAAGLNVVMNGSRAYLPKAAAHYPEIVPVLIAVECDILRQRLVSRGREAGPEIKRRLERARAYDVEHPALEHIDNSGELALAGERLLEIVRGRPLQKAV